MTLQEAARERRQQSLKGIPCIVCGSKTSAAWTLPTGQVICVSNKNGRDRCREREVSKMIQEGRAQLAYDEAMTSRG